MLMVSYNRGCNSVEHPPSPGDLIPPEGRCAKGEASRVETKADQTLPLAVAVAVGTFSSSPCCGETRGTASLVYAKVSRSPRVRNA